MRAHTLILYSSKVRIQKYIYFVLVQPQHVLSGVYHFPGCAADGLCVHRIV